MSGKMLHSSVPRRKTGLPFNRNCRSRCGRDREVRNAPCQLSRKPWASSFKCQLLEVWSYSSQSFACGVAGTVNSTFCSAPAMSRAAFTLDPETEISPRTGWPVAFRTVAITRAERAAAFGSIHTESIQTGSVADNSIRPTIPFQFVWCAP